MKQLGTSLERRCACVAGRRWRVPGSILEVRAGNGMMKGTSPHHQRCQRASSSRRGRHQPSLAHAVISSNPHLPGWGGRLVRSAQALSAKQGHSARAMRLRQLEVATKFPPEAFSMVVDEVSAAVAAHAADARARRGLQQTRCDDVDDGDFRSSARAEQRADLEMESPVAD